MSGRLHGANGATLYEHSAELFDLRYAQKDYGAEADLLAGALERVHPGATTLLDVACGTGQHLDYLRRRYRVEGLDINPKLLQTARARVPDVVLHEADMTRFRLGRSFDVITCLFASLPYLGTVEKMQVAVARMAAHLNPNGVLVLEPWLTPSAYRENEVVHNSRRTPERAVSWMYVQRRAAALAIWDIHWLVGTSSGVEYFLEREEVGLFALEAYVSAMQDAGLDVWHHPKGLHGYGAFWGRKGSRWSTADLDAINQVLPA